MYQRGKLHFPLAQRNFFHSNPTKKKRIFQLFYSIQVETRGLTEEGIYRVSGSEKEVKALEERFLHGRGIPVLANYDIHVICGCIKYFLRHLREPLIPTRLWVSFANAVRNPNDREAVRDLYESIKQLPQANRDTLAYLILHLQRYVDFFYVEIEFLVVVIYGIVE